MILTILSNDALLSATIVDFARSLGFAGEVSSSPHTIVDGLVGRPILGIIVDLDSVDLGRADAPLWAKYFSQKQNAHVVLIGLGKQQNLPPYWLERIDAFVSKPFGLKLFKKAMNAAHHARMLKRRDVLYLRRSDKPPLNFIDKIPVKVVSSIHELEGELESRGTEVGAILWDGDFEEPQSAADDVNCCILEWCKKQINWKGVDSQRIRQILLIENDLKARMKIDSADMGWNEPVPQSLAHWKLLLLQIQNKLNAEISEKIKKAA